MGQNSLENFNLLELRRDIRKKIMNRTPKWGGFTSPNLSLNIYFRVKISYLKFSIQTATEDYARQARSSEPKPSINS